MVINQKQFNMLTGPQGTTGDTPPSRERQYGKAYIDDLAAQAQGQDTSYFPDTGNPWTQGKLFHQPKPGDAKRWPRGYTPERQAEVQAMVEPRERPVRSTTKYSELRERDQARYPTEEKWEAKKDANQAKSVARWGEHKQIEAEYVDTVSRSDMPSSDVARMRHDPDDHIWGKGITVGRLPDGVRGRVAGQIGRGRNIEMPSRADAGQASRDWHDMTTLHEMGHAVDHVRRGDDGRPDMNDNQDSLRRRDDQVAAIRQLGEQEGFADSYAYKHTRGREGQSLKDQRTRDYPTGAYSRYYGSDTGWYNGGKQPGGKFTKEETKAFKGGYAAVHKAEGVRRPGLRGNDMKKAAKKSREDFKAKGGISPRNAKDTQLEMGVPDPEGRFIMRDEREEHFKANGGVRIPWEKY